MRLTHCYPNSTIRAKVLSAAIERGIDAQEDGDRCIVFRSSKDADEFRKVLDLLNSTRSIVLGGA